jgi:AbiV family abortive infection protein
MDLRAVMDASKDALASAAAAAARNALGLLHDAEALNERGCWARTVALSVMGVEECGKTVSLAALAVMPDKMRGQAPAGRMLRSHGLKIAGGLLASVVTVDPPGLAARLAAMREAEAVAVTKSVVLPTREADRLKRRALYAGVVAGGRISEPSEISEAEAAVLLGRARKAADSARVFLGPDAQARIASPHAEMIELAEALASSLAGASTHFRTPEAAVAVLLRAVRDLHARTALVSPRSA